MKVENNLDESTRYWFDKSMRWMDNLWSSEMSLCQSPPNRDDEDDKPIRYTVRNSVWYATGLLIRQSDGDIERTQRTIEAIMKYQMDEPDAIYHGTFYRYPGEPHPPENPREWRDYDPNWREFICSVFIILLKEYGDLLPSTLQKKMLDSILLAAEGAMIRKVRPEYTNISLMSAFLLDYAGIQFDNREWREYALEQAYKINELFAQYQTFHEYNSPTYYGVDLYALALWRKYGSTEPYQTMGATMESALWQDIAQFYHAGMCNMCGPYDRSYGMDMQDYIALVGLWIAVVLPTDVPVPMPDVDTLFNHSGDFFFAPLIALVDALPPDEVRPHFKAFQGERYLERIIEPDRTVTAWLSQRLMLGAESDLINRVRSTQFHPMTAHWVSQDGSLGWIRTRSATLIQAVVRPNEIRLWGTEDEPYYFVFEIHAKDVMPEMIQANRWTLPGITIEIQRPDTSFNVRKDGTSLIVQFVSDKEVTLTFKLD